MAQYGGYNNQQYGSSNNPYDQRENNPYDQRQDSRHDQRTGNQYSQPQYGNPYAQQGATQNRYGAGQQGGQEYYQGGQNDIEMGNMNNSNGPAQPPQQDPMAILNEVSAIRNGIGQVEQNIERIRQLSQQSRNDPDTSPNTPINRELNSVQAETVNLTKNFTERVRKLKGKRDYNLPQNRSQVDGVSRALEKAIHNFQSVAADADRKMKDQVKRQIRIVNPDASDAEVERAVEQGVGTDQIFAQALNRRGQSTTVLRAVQDRQEQLRRLEQAVAEVAELFNQINQAIIEQEPITQNLEEKTFQVKEDQEKAVQQLDQANVHARRRNRNKRWCLLVAIIIILIIVAAIVAWYFTAGPGNKNKSG